MMSLSRLYVVPFLIASLLLACGPADDPFAEGSATSEDELRRRRRKHRDAGTDAGQTQDAGTVAPDAGSSTPPPTTDAGTTTPPAEPDAGTVTPDTGTTTPDAGTTTTPDAGTTTPPPATGTRWVPSPSNSWQWQLTGTLDTSVNVDVYDIEPDSTTAAQVAALHAAGRKVICYISAGTWENWRKDKGDFPSAILGKTVGGWPDEKWLDIRALDSPQGPTGKTLRQIMEARMDACLAKGFDAIEPDNIDGYTNGNGFGLTYNDQLAYNKFLAAAAHARGLSIGLKNDKEQTANLVADFDFGIDEECEVWNECVGPGTKGSPGWTPFVQAGKAVFNAEYTDQLSSCKLKAGMSSIFKHRNLDAWRSTCK